MICRKNKIIGFGILLPVLLSVLFVSPSYAISDITLTSTTSNPCIGDCYSLGYRYVIISNSDPMSGSYQNIIRISFIYGNNSWNQNFPVGPLTIYSLPSDVTLSSITFISSNSTVVISDSLPDSLIPTPEPCPEPEEPEPCPTCPVVPDNPYDDKLDNITKAIYVCAGTLLVLYFFYTIYRIIIRNSGVK